MAVGVISGGHFVFMSGVCNHKHVKGLPELGGEVAILPGAVRKYKIQELPFAARRYTYDGINRLSRLLHTNAQNQAIEDYRYSYNVDDEIESITSLASSPLLPSAKSASAADAANRIAQFDSAAYVYDQVGKTTTKSNVQGATQYQWDARGRLIGVNLPNGQSINYGYDAIGRLASKTANGATTTFLYGCG